MEIAIQLPITVYVDNMGAIFLVNNQNMSDQMKSMDIWYHLLCEHMEDGMIKIQFVKSSNINVDYS